MCCCVMCSCCCSVDSVGAAAQFGYYEILFLVWLHVVFKTICNSFKYDVKYAAYLFDFQFSTVSTNFQQSFQHDVDLLIGIIINKELLLISINYYLVIVIKNFGCQIYLTFQRTVLFEVVQLIQLPEMQQYRYSQFDIIILLLS